MVCRWCMEYMDESAVVCPSCRRERKDFHQHKVLAYLFAAVFVLSLGYGLASGRWSSGIEGSIDPANVLSSLLGWTAIASLIACAICYVKASIIAKSWWWH